MLVLIQQLAPPSEQYILRGDVCLSLVRRLVLLLNVSLSKGNIASLVLELYPQFVKLFSELHLLDPLGF
jgi:hypothetical protein